jgi:hypothetical protein
LKTIFFFDILSYLKKDILYRNIILGYFVWKFYIEILQKDPIEKKKYQEISYIILAKKILIKIDFRNFIKKSYQKKYY